MTGTDSQNHDQGHKQACDPGTGPHADLDPGQDTPDETRNVTRPSWDAGDIGPKAVLDAQRQGLEAALAGAPATSCPWARATTPADQAARAAWVRGYAAGRTTLRRPASS